MASSKRKKSKAAKPKPASKSKPAAKLHAAKRKAAAKPKVKAAKKKAAPKKTAAKTTPAKKAPVKKAAVKKVAAKKAAVKKATAKPKADANRRQFDRRDTRITAELDHGGTVVVGTVTNLSLAGCLFSPPVQVAVGARVKLKLSGETPVSATVKGVSERGVHCLLHAGGVTLGRLSADLDDMALLMLNAGRPHEIAPPAVKTKK